MHGNPAPAGTPTETRPKHSRGSHGALADRQRPTIMIQAYASNGVRSSAE
jgi:hypothetical protein